MARVTISTRLLAVAVATLCLSVTPARARTVEEVVQKHLDWLNRVDNYVVEIKIKGMSTTLGRASVDNTKSPVEADFVGQQVPLGPSGRHALAISGSPQRTRAVLDGTRYTDWQLPAAPVFTLFQRGATLTQTMNRISLIATTTQVLENPVGRRVGLRMDMATSYLGKLETTLDNVLLGQPLAPTFKVTLWFNEDGRIDRMVSQEGKPDQVVTSLNYLAINVSSERRRELVPPMPVARSARSYPSFADMIRSVMQQEEGTGAQ